MSPQSTRHSTTESQVLTCVHCGTRVQRRSMPRHLRHMHGITNKRLKHALKQCPDCGRWHGEQNLAEHRRKIHGTGGAARAGGKAWRKAVPTPELDERIRTLKAKLKATPRSKDPAYWDALWDGYCGLLQRRHKERLRKAS